MSLFDMLMTYAAAMDAADLHDLREARKACDAQWNKGGGTQEQMDALCRVRGILWEEIRLQEEIQLLTGLE